MQYITDFAKSLQDLIENPSEDKFKNDDWNGFMLRFKSCCAWLEENKDRWQDIALYDIEDAIAPEPFRRLNYIGSLEFSVKEHWKLAVAGWIKWLENIRIEEEYWQKIVAKNIQKLEATLENPEVLAKEPYVFLGDFRQYGDILLDFDKDKFILHYLYDVVPDINITYHNYRILQETSQGGTGVLYLNNIEMRSRFIDAWAGQKILNRNLELGEYLPLTPEQILDIAERKEVRYRGLSVFGKGLWIPQQKVQIHDSINPDFRDEEEKNSELLNLEMYRMKDPKVIKGMVKSFMRSSFAQGFGGLTKNKELVEIFLQKASEDLGLTELLNMKSFSDEIAASAIMELSAGVGYRMGGMQQDYIRMKIEPEEYYELIGDFLMRAVRSRFAKDDSFETQAFFGWIGRRLMKQYVPETKLAIDESNQLAEKEKKEYLDTLDECIKRFEEGVKENLTFEKANEFFSKDTRHLRYMGLSEGNFVSRYVSHLWIDRYIGDYFDNEISKHSFMPAFTFKGYKPKVRKYLEKKKEYDEIESLPRPINTKEEYQKRGMDYEKDWDCGTGKSDYARTRELGLLPKDESDFFDDEKILRIWYETKRKSVIGLLKGAREDISKFDANYFAVIQDKEFRRGYQAAELAFEELVSPQDCVQLRFFEPIAKFPRLKEALEMTPEEICQKFKLEENDPHNDFMIELISKPYDAEGRLEELKREEELEREMKEEEKMEQLLFTFHDEPKMTETDLPF